MIEVRDMTGGCQCGAVRYSVTVSSDEAYLCHCAMCRRATGGAAAHFVNVKWDDVRWSGEPEWYRSSPIAFRPFCKTCGTPFGFRFAEGSDNLDLTLGTFDTPEHFRPTSNFSAETMLPHWQDVSHLKAQRLDEYQPLQDKWTKALGDQPD